MKDNWPKHPDGSNKKVGEMSKEEQKAVFKAALKRFEPELKEVMKVVTQDDEKGKSK